MNNNGWIKLHRKLLDNPLATKPSWAWLWIVLLLLANHDEDDSFIWNGKEVTLRKGQFITGRKKLNELTGIPETTIERILKYLENGQQIGQQKTTKYRCITILKWNQHQERTEKRTTNGQQTDTFKKLRSKEINTSDASIADDVEIILEPAERKAKKKETKFNPLGAEIIKAFENINPATKKMYNRPDQRTACDDLLKEYGLERTLKAVTFTEKTRGQPFFPTITTPVQLFQKWSALEQAAVRRKNESQVKNPIAFV